MKPSFVTPILKKAARKAGATILMEPEYQYAGQIAFPDGRRYYFKDAFLDLNTMGAAEIAHDKAYATFFMQKMGYPVIEGKAFLCEHWRTLIKGKPSMEAACAYAKKLGFPVIVKPNDLSQGIAVRKAHNTQELRAAIRAMPPASHAFLIQHVVSGNDYRLFVLDNQVIAAYQRLPLCVTGNGRASILALLKRKQEQFARSGRDTVINIKDPRIADKLKRQKLSFASIPGKGEKIWLLDNANLSTGGDAVDVTATIHPSYKTMAIRLTKDMGLRLCGVDIMTSKDITLPCRDYHVLEINAAAGLEYYAEIGARQRKIVEDTYLKILLALKAQA